MWTQQGENTTALTRAEILQGPAGEARNLERRRRKDGVQCAGRGQQQGRVGMAQPCRVDGAAHSDRTVAGDLPLHCIRTILN